MKAEPTKEHDFLQALVGSWDAIADATGSNPEHDVWREMVRSLEGLWIVCEGHGRMPGGGSAATLLTLGYDPAIGKYVGTWIDTIINHLWIYQGSLEPDGRTLVLETSGPDMTAPGRTAQYRERITLHDADNRSFASSVLTEAGDWQTLMTMRYRRSA